MQWRLVRRIIPERDMVGITMTAVIAGSGNLRGRIAAVLILIDRDVLASQGFVMHIARPRHGRGGKRQCKNECGPANHRRESMPDHGKDFKTGCP